MLTIRTARTIPRDHRRIYVDDHDLQNRANQTSLIKTAHGSKLRRSSIQHSSFQFISILLINPGSTWQRIISSIELLLSHDLFHQSSFYLAMIAHELFLQSSFYFTMNYFINPTKPTRFNVSTKDHKKDLGLIRNILLRALVASGEQCKSSVVVLRQCAMIKMISVVLLLYEDFGLALSESKQ